MGRELGMTKNVVRTVYSNAMKKLRGCAQGLNPKRPNGTLKTTCCVVFLALDSPPASSGDTRKLVPQLTCTIPN